MRQVPDDARLAGDPGVHQVRGEEDVQCHGELPQRQFATRREVSGERWRTAARHGDSETGARVGTRFTFFSFTADGWSPLVILIWGLSFGRSVGVGREVEALKF